MTNLTTNVAGTPAYAGSGAFGSNSFNGTASSIGATGVDDFLNDTGAPGGTLTTGTIEGWAKSSTTGTYTNNRVIVGHNANWWVGAGGTGLFQARYGGTSEVTINGTGYANADLNWFHWALVFDAGRVRLYAKGILQGSSSAVRVSSTTVSPFQISGLAATSALLFPGNVDEVRVSTVARYSGSTYTIPTAAFTPDGPTHNLFHLEGNGTDAIVAATAPVATLTTASGTDTISYTASTAGSVPIVGYALYAGASPGAESGTPVATATGAGAGSFTQPSPASAFIYYTVKAVDGSNVTLSPASNEVAGGGSTVHAPNHVDMAYSNYNWTISSGVAKTMDSGATLNYSIYGNPTSFTASFDISTMLPPSTRVGFKIDEGAWQDFYAASTITITMPTNTTWQGHTIEMKCIAITGQQEAWATQINALKFTGFTFSSVVASRPIQASSLKVWCLGDSLSRGIRAIALGTFPNDVDRDDARLGWAGKLGAILGAAVSITGHGGVGLAQSGDAAWPQFDQSAPYLWSGQARDITTNPPDVIVTVLGTNAGGVSATVQANALLLFNWILANTPVTTKIVVINNWRQTQSIEQQNAIAASTDPTRFRFVDATGWFNIANSSDGVHPYGYENTTNLTVRIAAEVRAALSVGRTFVYQGGGTWRPLAGIRV